MAKKTSVNVKKIIDSNQGIDAKLYKEAQALAKALPKGTKAGTGYRLGNPFKHLPAHLVDGDKETV